MITTQTIKDKQEQLTSYDEALTASQRLLTALLDYDKPTINKRFFDKYFLVKGEYRDYYEFSISEPQYDWEEGKRIYICRNHELELTGENPRDRIYIIQELSTEIAKIQSSIANIQSSITKLEAFNEHAFNTDLTMLYEKHNRPENWRQLLENGFYQRVIK